MRQIVLDTETTGLEPQLGHRIIEIGCVELINRRLTGRHYHQYINPEREVDQGAIEVHGITNEFLADKPSFAAIADEFWEFIRGAELVIHNAGFDIGFLNHEFARLNRPPVTSECTVLDTLALARQKHPGQKNSLDALCKRYGVDNSHRDLHGALLDSEILADVYLLMTGGQTALELGSDAPDAAAQQVSGPVSMGRISSDRRPLRIIYASAEELEAHQNKLKAIDKASGGSCIWLKQEAQA
ncbi:DNA polymerase III subunit epsilon [Saccharophagus sp. K07]|jgi:DNA polymerase-3 subunit epsilon|uniref:DNA polymerase III subunit epsilon n=1 Tax=Saccharophagus sp. K07 TaxID=2283636 RepID=UPI0016521E89|nr:DNA polymerase III subunit epsilon [Saccharophagus sp. K07]MBC6906901.1 DNA polymerase III subunit epsilon [Saccharophagus sp. K07]